MAPKSEKWTIEDGPNRWDLIFKGLVGQQDLTFALKREWHSSDGGFGTSLLSTREQFQVSAMLLEMGPAKCPFVTHVNDRSQDEWVILLIFRNGPFAEQYHSFYYNCSTRRGFMTKRLYTAQTPPL